MFLDEDEHIHPIYPVVGSRLVEAVPLEKIVELAVGCGGHEGLGALSKPFPWADRQVPAGQAAEKLTDLSQVHLVVSEGDELLSTPGPEADGVDEREVVLVRGVTDLYQLYSLLPDVAGNLVEACLI